MNKTLIKILITAGAVGSVFFAGKYYLKSSSFNTTSLNQPAEIKQNQMNQNNISDLTVGNNVPSNQPSEEKTNSGVIDDGKLHVEILQEGTGEGIKNGETATVHYTGTLKDGAKFDSSLDRGQPFQFTLGARQVIQGWDQGILGMKVGEKRKLIIPSALGYGDRGAGGIIPPNALLIFEVELLKIN